MAHGTWSPRPSERKYFVGWRAGDRSVKCSSKKASRFEPIEYKSISQRKASESLMCCKAKSYLIMLCVFDVVQSNATPACYGFLLLRLLRVFVCVCVRLCVCVCVCVCVLFA